MSAKGDKVKLDKENARDEVTFERIEVTSEEIAIRAYEIHVSGAGGDAVENWLRAEKELTTRPRSEQKLEAGQEAEQDAHAAE